MISVVVMAHPKRRHFVEELLPKLDRHADVVYDRHDDRWETGRRALLAHHPEASHHLVVQDDAVPCRDLVAGVERACAVAGEHPIALYTGRARPSQGEIAPLVRSCEADGRSWFAHEGPWWGVAIVVPTSHIPQLIAWCDEKRDIANYDRRIARYYKIERRVQCYYTQPSLVDHRPVKENPSLVEGRTANRQAHRFIGADRSALEVEWDTEVLTA